MSFRFFRRQKLFPGVSLPITGEVVAIIGADHRGHPKRAIAHLRQRYRQDSQDVVIRLALAELLVEESGSKKNCQTVVRLAYGWSMRTTQSSSPSRSIGLVK